MRRIPPFWLLLLVVTIEIFLSYLLWLNGSIYSSEYIEWGILAGFAIGSAVVINETQRCKVLGKRGESFNGISFIPHFIMYLLIFLVLSIDEKLKWLALIVKSCYMMAFVIVIAYLQIKKKRLITWDYLLGK